MRNDEIFNFPRFKNLMSCLIQKLKKSLKINFMENFVVNIYVSIVAYF